MPAREKMSVGNDSSAVIKRIAWMGAGGVSLLVLASAVWLVVEAPPGAPPEPSAGNKTYVRSRSRAYRPNRPNRTNPLARGPRRPVTRPPMLPSPALSKTGARPPTTTIRDRHATTLKRPDLKRSRMKLDRLKRPNLAARRPGRLSKEELEKRREERRKRQVERLRKRIQTLEDRIDTYRQDGTRTEAQISRMERSLDRMKKRLKRMDDEQRR